MSQTKKVLIVRIILGVLTALVLLLGSLTIINYNKVNRLETQIVNLKTVNESLESSAIENFVVLNFVDLDGSVTPYLVDKTLEISIYDFLLTTNKFTDSDFASYDEVNFYFNSSTPNVFIKTDVLELKDDEDYYDLEWGSLVVGLQAIILDKNYTVVRDKF